MNFSENTNLMPGGQSANPSKVKELENRIDDLQQTVTSVADSVADLSNEVNTHELNADTANIGNAVIDNATVGAQTVMSEDVDTLTARQLQATTANIDTLESDIAEVRELNAENAYFNTANAQSFTGQGVSITGDITASNKVQGKTVQATEKVVTPALESTQTELKGVTTVRGDVYFPEHGDKIYGEYLEIEADKVKADIEAETVSATTVAAGTVTGTAIAAQGLLVTGNSRFMGEVQARDIVPEPGQTLDITTDTLDADSIDADTVKVNSLTTETPVDTNFLVGYDENGNLIPVDASLDPANLWKIDEENSDLITPKNNRKVKCNVTIDDVDYTDVDSAIEALKDYAEKIDDEKIDVSAMGVANGVATLDEAGKIPSSQLPGYVDDVIEGYYNNGNFYKDNSHTVLISPEEDKIYIDLSSNKTYRWSGSTYIVIASDLALGETSATAYRGDRGKTAYDHSQLTSGNPHNVTKSDVGLSNVPNVTTNNQTPTYTEASSNTALSSGETLATAFGKIAKAISSLISHLSNTSNPHSVTKAQVGLNNVPNVTTNNQTPTYTEASSNTALSSGETLATAFGKIAKAISSLISHLSNTSNPHSVTKSQVGLGNVDNTADANKSVNYAASAGSATNATYATKIGSSSSHSSIGGTSTPVYVNSNGTITACSLGNGANAEFSVLGTILTITY